MKDLNCLHNLAVCYRGGIGVEKNPEKAFELFTKSANCGNQKSHYQLGVMYAKGLGVEKNSEKAFAIFKKETNDLSCLHNLALCYHNGKGVKKNPKKAFDLLLRAAGKGSASSKGLLGYYYQSGIVVEKDNKQGFQCFREAVDEGFRGASFSLATSTEQTRQEPKFSNLSSWHIVGMVS